MKSKGLGDTIEKITETTGIKKLVELIPGDCNCNKRKEKSKLMLLRGKYGSDSVTTGLLVSMTQGKILLD